MNTVFVKNKPAYWLVNLLMIFIFGADLLLSITDLLGLNSLNRLVIPFTHFLVIFVFAINVFSNENKLNRGLCFIYLVYSTYCIYYTLNPQLPRMSLNGVPKDNYSLWNSIIYFSLVFMSVPTLLKHFDAKFFSLFFTIVCGLYFPYYFSNVDTGQYILYAFNELDNDTFFDSFTAGFLEPFTLSHIAAFALLSSVFLWTTIKEKEIFVKVLLIVSCIINSYAIILAGKRGPVLMLILTLVLYFYCKFKISKKAVSISLLIALLLYIFSDTIIYFLITNDFSAGFMDRTLNTEENGGSGRFGSDDSVFAYAFKQISQNPLFGTYFRLTDKTSNLANGSYPHNWIFESIMTFGLVFSLPFYRFIYDAIKKAYCTLKENGDYLFCALAFIYFLLCYLVSGSIFLSYEFWLFLAIFCNLPSGLKDLKKYNNYE